MLSGFLTGLAGVLFMAWQGGGSMEIGKNMSVPLFASVVAGGTALTGGVGGPHRTLLGVMIITWSEVGMMMLALPDYIIMVFFGLIAIGMSIATIDRRRIKIIK
jgi:ribose transport system permease protein/putative xylitol transport system permease protein